MGGLFRSFSVVMPRGCQGGTKGAGHGPVNDGISVCKYKHDPSKENSDPKEVMDHLATIPCNHGADCPHKDMGCLHRDLHE